MDLFSRKIVSWELAPTLEASYVVNAVKKAVFTTGKKPKVIHTDYAEKNTMPKNCWSFAA
jgi:transposase InsO family protein